ncbi:hypothetical protein BC833DRAFT_163755 [Globomyces pollinis-pini]|nr:hypothetical protein BC833DRAFT_163755 [Globomyces pollinis-pini]
MFKSMLKSMISFLFFYKVQGNAEKIMIHSMEDFKIGDYVPTHPILLSYPYSSTIINLNITADYLQKSQDVFVQIQSTTPDSVFELRSCWAATDPVDFYFSICKNCIHPSIIVSAVYNGVNSVPQIEPPDIKVKLVVEQLVLKVVPISTIYTIVLGCLILLFSVVFLIPLIESEFRTI